MKGMSALIALTVTIAACSSGEAKPPFPDQPWRQVGDVVDSLVPMEELMARFRNSVPERTAFSGGAGSVEEFAREFLAAVGSSDSAALATLRVSTGEFAWLLAEEHLYTRPPYELDPALLWMQISAGSEKGQRRLMERLAGRRLELAGIECRPDTLQFPGGGIRAWSGCMITWRSDGAESTSRLFGTLIERDGMIKVLGYGNDY